MSISLNKGERLSLDKQAPNLKKVLIGLGWDARATDGVDFDLDASAFMLGADGKVRSEVDFIFYNQLKSACGSVQHTGDNRTGAGEGDDEVLMVDLTRVPADVQKIVFRHHSRSRSASTEFWPGRQCLHPPGQRRNER